MTPFCALYGRPAPPLIRYEQGSAASTEVESHLVSRDAILLELKEHLHQALLRMQQSANTHRRDINFDVGDHVFVKLRPYRQQTLCTRLNEKLAPRYFGPFEVLRRIGQVAYQLKLPSAVKIHDVFHVSQLKKAIGSHEGYSTIPYHLTSDLELLVEPLEVRGVRPTMQHEKTGREVFIRWKDLPTFKDSWEPFEVIQHQFQILTLRTRFVFGWLVMLSLLSKLHM